MTEYANSCASIISRATFLKSDTAGSATEALLPNAWVPVSFWECRNIGKCDVFVPIQSGSCDYANAHEADINPLIKSACI